MPDWHDQRCAVCGGTLVRELLRITEPDRFERHVGVRAEGYSRHWVECEQCGAATNVQDAENRRRLDEIAAGYYEVDLAGRSIADKFEKVMALPPEQSDNAQRVARIHAFLRTRGLVPGAPKRALDIGAGTGVFLARFLSDVAGEGWNAIGVEPDPVAASHLRTLGRFHVIEGMFTASLGLHGFDLVTLNKVVEHLYEPVGLVRDAASALNKRQGVIYLELPDKLTASRRPPSDNILGALHCHLYDTYSISTLLSRAGLVTLHAEQVFEPSGKITVAAFAAHESAVPVRAAGVGR